MSEIFLETVAETLGELHKERDALRAENEKLKGVLETIIQTANKFNRLSELGIKADNGETLISIIEEKAQEALNEVTK